MLTRTYRHPTSPHIASHRIDRHHLDILSPSVPLVVGLLVLPSFVLIMPLGGDVFASISCATSTVSSLASTSTTVESASVVGEGELHAVCIPALLLSMRVMLHMPPLTRFLPFTPPRSCVCSCPVLCSLSLLSPAPSCQDHALPPQPLICVYYPKSYPILDTQRSISRGGPGPYPFAAAAAAALYQYQYQYECGLRRRRVLHIQIYTAYKLQGGLPRCPIPGGKPVSNAIYSMHLLSDVRCGSFIVDELAVMCRAYMCVGGGGARRLLGAS